MQPSVLFPLHYLSSFPPNYVPYNVSKLEETVLQITFRYP